MVTCEICFKNFHQKGIARHKRMHKENHETVKRTAFLHIKDTTWKNKGYDEGAWIFENIHIGVSYAITTETAMKHIRNDRRRNPSSYG